MNKNRWFRIIFVVLTGVLLSSSVRCNEIMFFNGTVDSHELFVDAVAGRDAEFEIRPINEWWRIGGSS